MTILILSWRDLKHPMAGGAEISLLEHAKYWKRRKARILWFCSSFRNAKKNEVYEGIEFVRRGSQYTVHIHAVFYYFLHLSKRVDIIVDNFHGLPFFTPFYVKRNKIIALINEPAKEVWFKNLPWPISMFAYYLEPLFFKFYKNIPFITSADSIVNELVSFGLRKKNINVIKHGITILSVNAVKKEKYPVLLYLSQLSKDKGIEDAIDAYEIVKRKNKDVAFWVVGKATNLQYAKKIKEEIKKRKLRDIVIFGYVTATKKFQLLKKSWLLIHPSVREGWGLNVIEANACGRPAIGYNVTGLRDSIVDGKTGILTKTNSPADLARKIQVLIEDEKKYSKLSKNAFEWSKKFSWNNAGEESWSLINNVYAKSKK